MSNSTPLFFEDEFWFYYGAYRFPWNNGARTQVSGIGLATMPRDRFAGIRPLERFGQLTLKPISLDGIKGQTLNADAAGGEVRVEVLNEDGYRVRGYSKDDAIPITGDGLKHPVRWTERDLSALSEDRFMLRLHLDDAEVYALTLYT